MYRLYWAPRTGAFMAEAALAEIGAAAEFVLVDKDAGEHLGDDFRALNPAGQIPVLVLEDGTVMTETAAMLVHLADLHPEAGLLPPAGSPERATALRWLMFALCNIYESDLRHAYTQRYTTDPDGLDGVKRAAEQRWDDSFAIVEATLDPGPYLLGQDYSGVDMYLAVLVAWHYDTSALMKRSPNLTELCRRVRNREALAPLFEKYRLTDLDHLAEAA
jgi:glutathione S-transferase